MLRESGVIQLKLARLGLAADGLESRTVLESSVERPDVPMVLALGVPVESILATVAAGAARPRWLPSQGAIWGPWGRAQLFLAGQGFPTVVGSVIVETQLGSVKKEWAADLGAGTWRLPPCDFVRVSVVVRRLSGPVLQDIPVTAAVQSAHEGVDVLPWTYTIGAYRTTGSFPALHQVVGIRLPPSCYKWRPRIDNTVYTGAPSNVLTGTAKPETSTTRQFGTTPMQPGWQPVSRDLPYADAVFSFTAGAPLRTPFVSLECRVRP